MDDTEFTERYWRLRRAMHFLERVAMSHEELGNWSEARKAWSGAALARDVLAGMNRRGKDIGLPRVRRARPDR